MVPNFAPLFICQVIYNTYKFLRSLFRLEELILRYTIPELLAQLRFHRAGMDANADTWGLAQRELIVKCLYDLIKRRFGGTVRIPATLFVIFYAPNACRYMDPLCKGVFVG